MDIAKRINDGQALSGIDIINPVFATIAIFSTVYFNFNRFTGTLEKYLIFYKIVRCLNLPIDSTVLLISMIDFTDRVQFRSYIN